ncbi:MAG TPA: inositol polyphosphate kinase family protein [Steroidobacteraceae bacterium]
MPGGHGGWKPLEDGSGTGWKETSQTELNFYTSIYKAPTDGRDGPWDINPEASHLQGLVPEFYGSRTTEDGKIEIRIEDITHGIKTPATMETSLGEGPALEGPALETHGVEEHDIEENPVQAPTADGQVAKASLMDVKVGGSTASRKELMHGGMSTTQAWIKKQKMDIADHVTKSAERGYRVIAASGETDNRTALARQEPRGVFGRFFANDPQRLHSAGGKLEQLQQAVDQGSHTFIGSSVLFCHDKADPQKEPRMLLIDFGHTHARGAVQGLNDDKYQGHFSTGLRNLRNELDGARRNVQRDTRRASQEGERVNELQRPGSPRR